VEQLRKGKFSATVDGITFETEAVSGVEVVTWLIHGENETIHAHAKSLSVDKVDVWITNMPFEATVQLVGVGGYAITPEPQKIAGGKVFAVMPGRITSILVREGELVSEGSPLLILEAMKMQNEITSPISGRVKSVLVLEGATVKKDENLVIVDSDTK
jgi:biotin carboxyl carrier protein